MVFFAAVKLATKRHKKSIKEKKRKKTKVKNLLFSQRGTIRRRALPEPNGSALIKSFWKSRNLFSKRFLAAGGKIFAYHWDFI
jgi:hypothetical protein